MLKGKKARERSGGSSDGPSGGEAKVARVGGSPPLGERVRAESRGRSRVKKISVSRVGDGSLSGSVDGSRVGSADGLGVSSVGDGSIGVVPSAGVRRAPKRGDRPTRAMRVITSELVDVAMSGGVSREVLRAILGLVGKYEDVLLDVMLENESLKGKLEVLSGGGLVRAPVVSGVSAVPSALGVPAPTGAAPAPKPVETWSAVVRSKDAGASSGDVVKKVVEEVAPALGVRVHEVRAISSGGVVIRTPSVSERNRIVANGKFDELGLDVSVNRGKGTKVVVRNVDSCISPGEFMDELFEKNLKQVISLEAFRKDVRIVSLPWKADAGTVTVVLEGSVVAMDALLRNDRCYIKWFAFPLRRDARVGCYRCCGTDHFLRECRVEGVVCHRCGQVGHFARECVNALSCRNCAFRGRPDGHLMMSEDCPLYSSYVARQNSRH